MISIFTVPFVHAAVPGTSSHVFVTSTLSGEKQILFVPANSTGSQAYPDWNITIIGSGSFSIAKGNLTIESGYSSGVDNIPLSFPQGSIVSIYVTFLGTTYSFADVSITGPLTNLVTQYVTVSSSYPGQNQFLTVLPGQSGVLMYPDWNLSLYSSVPSAYSIYVGTQMFRNGTFTGQKYVTMNVSGSPASITVAIGSKTFRFQNEIIATVPLHKYYGPTPPPLIYTTAQYEEGIAKAFVASLFAIFVSLLTVRKYVIEREKREVLNI